ncbi:MAG: methyltransferase domain-containing protein [Deltaproteobacteria bacterium]|nr:methyltransferase domain-containing protein [Deltaproteobacteria bacterium]
MRKSIPAAWFYDEGKHCGVDYNDEAQAKGYDDGHQQLRNVADEFSHMMSLLELADPGAMTVLDIGCGTGLFTNLLADTFAHVHAVDISAAMLERTREKTQGRKNVTLHRAGFLTYEHTGTPVNVAISKMALHHLPDFWKQAAFLRLNAMLDTGGLLYIHDVVFDFAPPDYPQKIPAWIDAVGTVAGDRIRRETETHIRDEYSTFAWILDGMLERAGFSVEKYRTNGGFIAEYVCRKA